MAKKLDASNLGYFIGKIKAAFWLKSDVVQIAIDNTPTKNSDNLVKSGGVFGDVHPAVVTTKPSGGFAPNVPYILGTLTGSQTFTLAAAADATILNHWYWSFQTGSTAPTITWPSGLSWFGGNAPTIAANKHYEISIIGTYAVAVEI